MDSKNSKKIIWFIAAIIIGFVIIIGSYFIGNSRQKERLEEQAQNYIGAESNDAESESSQSSTALNMEQLVTEFNKDRTKTTAAAYLSYVASEDMTPKVASLITNGSFAAINENAVNGLVEHGIEGVTYESLDYLDQSLTDIDTDAFTDQLIESAPSLLIVNLPIEAAFNNDSTVEDFTADLATLHETIRSASPETLVTYAVMPTTKQETMENEEYVSFASTVSEYLAEENHNTYHVDQIFNAADQSTDKYSDDGSISEDSFENITTSFTQALIDIEINAINGFGGENTDIEKTEEVIEEPIIEESESEEPEMITTTETIEEQETSSTEYVEVTYLAEGEEEVVQEGVDSVYEVTYEVVTLDGVEQSRQEISRNLIANGTPRVINIGVAPAPVAAPIIPEEPVDSFIPEESIIPEEPIAPQSSENESSSESSIEDASNEESLVSDEDSMLDSQVEVPEDESY